MKIGQLIRRKSKSGKSIGPYLVVVGIKNNIILANPVGYSKLKVEMLKSNVNVIKTTTLYVSKPILSELSCSSKICVSHIASARWNAVIEKNLEVVRLRCKPQEYEHIFVIENARYEYSFGEKVVKIFLSYKLI